MTEEKVNELRMSWNHFDKSREGLDKEQLKSCLISLGYSIKPAEVLHGRLQVVVL